MQVKDGLACACARVDGCAVAAFEKPLLVGNARTHAQQVAEQGFILLRGVVQRFYMVARNDEQVNGRLRIGVTKSNATLVLKYAVSGNFTRHDSTKETILVRHN